MDHLFSAQFWNDSVPCHLEFRNPQPPFPLHSHDFYEIVIVYGGSGTHVACGVEKKLREGDVLVLRPGQVHGYKDIQALVLMNLLVRPSYFLHDGSALQSVEGFADLFEPLTRSDAEKRSVASLHLNQVQLLQIKDLLQSVQNEIVSQYLGSSIQIDSMLSQVLLYLLRVHANPEFPSGNSQNNVALMVSYMDKNFRKEITMDDLTELGAMSESSVLRAFKKVTGYAPFAYQMRLRLFAAINELVNTSVDITQIAYDCGFNDSNYFSRCFKKFLNMTPREYRKNFSKSR